MKKWLLCLLLILTASTVLGSIEPVWTDGYLAAGDKTVGTAVRYMRIGMWPEAERTLRRSLGYRPENHAAQFNLGLCHLRKGQIKMAERFFQKAIDLRPEPLYCEALAQLESALGTAAEFGKFLIPCVHECDHGYAFARAGLWQEAETRFAAALADDPNAITWFNRAITNEVLGQHTKALRFLNNARSLRGQPKFDQFAAYLENAPNFPLEMLVVLPELTLATELEPIHSMFASRSGVVIRYEAMHSSPAIGVIEKNTPVDILEHGGAWFRVRTKQQKEGYVPAFLLSETLVPDVQTVNIKSYSQPYIEPEEPVADTNEEALDAPAPDPVFSVKVNTDGSAVAVRTETSLMAEIVGYVDPGRKLRVRACENNKWLEIVSGQHHGFILKSYIEMPEPHESTNN